MIETRFKNSEVGLIPEDWEVKPIGSVADILNGSTPPTANPKNYGTTHLFVSPADLGDSKYIENTIKKLSTIGFSMSRIIPKGSILYTCTGSTIGKCGIAFCDLTSNQQINAVLPNGSYNNEYLYYAIQTRESDIRSNASVQAVPLINKTTFSKTLVAFPQKTERRVNQQVQNYKTRLKNSHLGVVKFNFSLGLSFNFFCMAIILLSV